MAKIGYTQSTATVTNSAADIFDASYARDIIIQNNDSSGNIYLNFSGTATAADTMIKISPGGSIDLKGVSNAISAIGDIASNANIATLVKPS